MTAASTAKAIPLSLRRKRSSRIAAIQILYRIGINGESFNANKALVDFDTELEESKATDDAEWQLDPKPDMAYFKTLLTAIGDWSDRLESVLEKHLTADWKKDRMSPLLLALLRVALVELRTSYKLTPAMLISEYTDIGGGFFTEHETGFINAFLQSASRDARPDA